MRLQQFSIESDDSAKSKRVLLFVLIVVAAIFSTLLVREYGFRTLFLSPTWAGFLALSAALRSAKEAKWKKDPSMRKALDVFRGLKGIDFDEACARLDENGSLVRCEKVRLVDPRTWGNKQRLVTIEYWPFLVTVTEKFGRVCRIQVVLDEDKIG